MSSVSTPVSATSTTLEESSVTSLLGDPQLAAMFDSLLESTTKQQGASVRGSATIAASTDKEPSQHANTNLVRVHHRKAPVHCGGTLTSEIAITDISDTLDAISDSGIPCEIEQSITELIETTGGAQQPSLAVSYASDAVRELYQTDSPQYSSDSGWDLRFTEDVLVQPGETVKCDFGLSVCAHDVRGLPSAVFVLPRSSIVKTPLRMANSMGLIDSSYRGTLKAFVDNIKTEPYQIKRGDRLFQLLAPSAIPFQVSEVSELSSTERGQNGFGSTGQ